MLSELYISNFGLIDDITVNFDKGLNIFTGATGVGKSLIIGALNFILGSRATTEIIRSNKKDATVSGVFLIENKQVLDDINKLFDGTMDEEIIVQRSYDQNGRNKCKLNNQPITVALLKEIGELLVNIHGQHEHESLTNPSIQLSILDGFGKLNTLRDKFSNTYNKAIEKEKLLNSLINRKEDRNNQIGLYQFEINEIESAGLKPDELKTLEEERSVLANSEKIQNTINHCFNSLYEADNSIIARLKEAADELDKIKEFDKGFEGHIEVCNQSIYQLEDVAVSLRNDIDKYEFDPERLGWIEERLETIRRLKGKYGETIKDILSYCKETKAKLDQLLKANEDLGSAGKELDRLMKSAFSSGKELTRLRKKAGTKLSSLIKKELADLGINDGRFEVNISTLAGDNEEQFKLNDANSTGLDQIEFMFSSNPGEDIKPLRKIASGGEISRIMLALKKHLALADQTPVLVFDEIDANIGGRMGRVIGEKLKLVSQSHQIICITHLPQIAGYADQHLKVNKSTSNNRTSTSIETLSDKDRLEEIAEMIRGPEKTGVTRKQAKEMIDDAKKFLQSIST